ncbi:hypothetical protein [Segeticoccus rhizosphaerae]|uniref:hypothetical protein n=1 Tax=Segeticoccus rhizosphaerae TaxID=1104777 RepID=UPI0012652972|nr:hypothetical protein [Segeticoccus rhizosphaerae]
MATTRQVFVDHDGQRLGIRVHAAPVADAPALVFWPAMGVPAGPAPGSTTCGGPSRQVRSPPGSTPSPGR